MPIPPQAIAAILKLVLDGAGGSQAQPNAGQPGHAPLASASALASADNLADASNAILECYHHTARYQRAQIVERPWSRQTEFGAAQSLLIRIEYVGVTSTRHVMTAALMVRPDALRAFVVTDANSIPSNKNCALNKWVPTAARPKQ